MSPWRLFFAFLVHRPMDNPAPQLLKALPSAGLFPAQLSCPETGPAAHSSLPRGHHSSSSHRSFGSHEVLESMEAALAACIDSDSAAKCLKHQHDPGRSHTVPLPLDSTMHPLKASSTRLATLAALQQTPRSYFMGFGKSAVPQLRHVRMRSHAISNSSLFNVVFANVKPHCQVALNRLQQLRSTANLPLDEIEDACNREDETEFASVFSSRAPFSSKSRNRRNSSPQAANGLVLFAVSHTCGKNAQRRSVLAVLLVVEHVRAWAFALKAFHSGSAMESSHQHMEEMPSATNKPTPTTALCPGLLRHTNGITMHPLGPPIATTFANNSSEVIRFATEPLQRQCQGHRSFVHSLVSDGVSFDLLVGLDWLQKNNPRVNWDHESLMLSDSDHCYKWQAVYSDAEFHDESVAIRLCTARQIRPYPAANEAYCN
ncbi:hypothetical protein Efla_002435 [Eimeria flavescens]